MRGERCRSGLYLRFLQFSVETERFRRRTFGEPISAHAEIPQSLMLPKIELPRGFKTLPTRNTLRAESTVGDTRYHTLWTGCQSSVTPPAPSAIPAPNDTSSESCQRDLSNDALPVRDRHSLRWGVLELSKSARGGVLSCVTHGRELIE